MFRLKMINKPKLFKLKFNFIFPQIVLANMQEKEITPTKETQIVEPDRNYDGLKKVTVNKIPDEYIIPSGEIDITQNGTYNVVDKATANVNIPEKQLGTKTITKNGIYKATDDNLDGYSEVKVETSGVDINDYFVTTITTTNYIDFGYNNFIKQVPEINIDNNVTTLSGAFLNMNLVKEIQLTGATQLLKNMNRIFYGCRDLQKIKLNIDTSNVTNLFYAFEACQNLIELPEMNTQNVFNMSFMCYNCKKLVTVPKLKANSVININGSFIWCDNLTNLGGFENLGQAYETTANANNDSYQLNLSYSTKLTHESLMNVINNLYDIKAKGCKAQQLILGSTNIAKLTAEELAAGTSKGWTIS